jgi:DNA-binding MarR family transcriptional regulator
MTTKHTANKELENMGFMLQDVARLMRRNFNRRLQDLNLTQAQWRALSILWRNPGIRQSQLADILEMQPISVGRLLDRMQASGWVERRPDPGDRRALQLHLTEKAEPILARIRADAARLRDDVLNGISENDQEIFLALLTRMRASLCSMEQTN